MLLPEANKLITLLFYCTISNAKCLSLLFIETCAMRHEAMVSVKSPGGSLQRQHFGVWDRVLMPCSCMCFQLYIYKTRSKTDQFTSRDFATWLEREQSIHYCHSCCLLENFIWGRHWQPYVLMMGAFYSFRCGFTSDLLSSMYFQALGV